MESGKPGENAILYQSGLEFQITDKVRELGHQHHLIGHRHSQWAFKRLLLVSGVYHVLIPDFEIWVVNGPVLFSPLREVTTCTKFFIRNNFCAIMFARNF